MTRFVVRRRCYSTVMPMTDGDALVQRCLLDRGYTEAEQHEPDLGITRRPDFLVHHAGRPVVIEVKTPSTSPILKRTKIVGPNRAFTMGADELHKPIRSAVKEASEQLKPLRERRCALVVAVANPHGLLFDHSAAMVLGALYGNQAVVLPYDNATGTLNAEAAAARFTRNGKLTNDHPYVSGVVLVDPGPDGVPVARAFETITAAVTGEAVSLPLGMFAGPHDRRYSWRREGDDAVFEER